MKKLISSLAVVAVLAAFGATPAFALASSKFAAALSDVTLVPSQTASDWTTVLHTSIKTPNKKDLLIGGSLETALFTQTQVRGKNGSTDSSSANATLDVRILIDGKEYNRATGTGAFPPQVVYDHRAQTLSATLGGVIASCTDLNGDGVIDVATECVVTDEMIELILETMSAHHFNFVAANLAPGVHQVELQVKVGSTASSIAGSASAMAGVGRGSLTIEEVKGINQIQLGAGIEFLQ